jgi:hypothetical protein
VGIGGLVESSSVNEVVSVRETGVTGKASHRGHRGHGGGLGACGPKFFSEQGGFSARNGRNGESIALLGSQYGSNWKREASDKLRSAHPAFALELNLK